MERDRSAQPASQSSSQPASQLSSPSSSQSSHQPSNAVVLLGSGLLLTLGLMVLGLGRTVVDRWMAPPTLLSDPFLQLPTASSVNVVWFTEFPGTEHRVYYGPELSQVVTATTTQLSRTREDDRSHVHTQAGDGSLYPAPSARPIWRHEATVTALATGQRLPYRVSSTTDTGRVAHSQVFTLQPLPASDAELNILLTSDHQLMPMTPANLHSVVQTVEPVDAVFLAGDLVNIPDRASEWFDDRRGRAFFPALQGRAAATLADDPTQTVYRGGAIIQSAPLFPALGNHEVMGRWSMDTGLNNQFNDPVPRAIALQHYLDAHPKAAATDDIASPSPPEDTVRWMTDQSFNTITTDEIFSLPTNTQGHSRYYAVTMGNVRLVVLYATNIWRRPSLNSDVRGRYREADSALNDPQQWGHGQHIFEPIAPGSEQYQWLQAELSSDAFQQAQYRVVMFHHPPHSLGDNVVPAYTDPVQHVDRWEDGAVKAVRYEYPKSADYLIRDVIPLLEAADTHLVFFGHSHLWNRFTSPNGLHFLESSNVGNTYGAFWSRDPSAPEVNRRPIPIGYDETYVPLGDPNGLAPIVPSIEPLLDADGEPQPYIASNTMTVFSILNTQLGTVSSYRFDTTQPQTAAVKFDEFELR